MLARYEQRYPDFGPTQAAEYLADEGLAVDHEALRRWLIAQATRKVRGWEAASGLARTQSLLWDDRATGRVASRLV